MLKSKFHFNIFNKMKIINRLIVLTVVLILLSVAVGIIGQNGIRNIQRQMDSLYFDSLKANELAYTLQSTVFSIESDINFAILMPQGDAESIKRLTAVDMDLTRMKAKLQGLKVARATSPLPPRSKKSR